MQKKLLLTPGPTPVPEDVLEAIGKPMIHHRHEPFKAIIAEVKEGLKDLFQTRNDVLILASSGTGAMEGSVVNFLSKGDTAVVVRAGKFGERWGEICEAYGVKVVPVDVEWGRAVAPAQVKAALDQAPDARAVFIQASETSTAVLHPIKEIADLVAPREGTILVVDAITALGVCDIRTDEWNLDVVVTGSQKAMMLPTGLAFASVSDKAWGFNERSDLPRFYFDFAKERKNLAKNQTAYSSPVSLIVGLQVALKRMQEEGLQSIFARSEQMARATRAGVKAIGLELFAPDAPSPACTAVEIPDSIDGTKIPSIIRDHHGVAIAGGQAHLKGKIVRIAHMGHIYPYDILSGLTALEFTLRELGYTDFETGASVQAALSILAP